MKLAYFGIPHVGGTYTVFRSLRTGLAPHGIDVRWLGVGPDARAAVDARATKDDLLKGCVVAGDDGDERAQAAAVDRHLLEDGYDCVFINALAGRFATNMARFLDPAIKRVMIVHSTSFATYAAARSVQPHVHATIGVSPRIRNDLVGKHGFPADRTHAIPTAVDLDRFRRADRPATAHTPLRLLSLGRIMDMDKGVFWLAEIMARLDARTAQLTVAGDGPDLDELKRRCAPLGDRVRFVGRIAAEEVPAVLADHDVFVFPSRFEGLGLSMVEAMAAGCVPVASRIKGVTDHVVQDGQNGLLFPIGDPEAAARAIERLAGDPETLARMSGAARRATDVRFALATMADAYRDVLRAVTATPPPIAEPLPIGRWRYPQGLKPGLRALLPADVKAWLRLWRERLA